MNAIARAASHSPEQGIADQSALIRVLGQINRSLDQAEVYQASLEGVQRVVGGDFGCFLLIQPDTPALRLAHVTGLPASLLEQLQSLTFDHELINGEFMPENQIRAISILGEKVCLVLEAQNITSFALLPLTARGHAVGILLTGGGAGRVLAPSGVDLLMSIGEQVGMAIENARLYEQTQQRVQELDGLAQLTAACAASLDPQAICDLAVEWTEKLLRATACSIRFIEQGQLRLGAARGQRQGVGVPELLEIGDSSRSIIEQQVSRVVNDWETDTSQSSRVRRLVQEHGMRASVAVPLLVRRQAIGILGVADAKPRQWSPHEIDLLQTIANQVATGIDNAQLFQNMSNEKRKVQAIFDSGLSGLYATDAAGKIVMFNRAAERITGWTLDEVRGKNWAEWLSDRAAGNPVEPLLDEALLRKKTAYAFEGRRMRTRDGRIIPAAKAVAPLLDEKEDVIGAVGAFWDLSKEQRAEIEYENFLAMVAHQLRSPLTAVLSALELFERRNLSEERRTELWAIVKAEGNQLKKLADQFLEHQAAVKSTLPLKFETLSVVSLARQLVRQFQTDKSQHRFRVQSSNPEPLAFADSNRVENVLRNLLDNAVSYSPVGSLITLRIKRQDEEWIDVSVQDFGAGIPPAEQTHLFQPFYRVPQTSERRVYGHGLGLALAKETVTAMGGRIWVESEPEHGATFHFTLRRAQ